MQTHEDDSTRAAHEHKSEWRLIPLQYQKQNFVAGQNVFVRTKSANEIGRRGNVVHDESGDGSNNCSEADDVAAQTRKEQRVCVQIPIDPARHRGDSETAVDAKGKNHYLASVRPNRMVPIYSRGGGTTILLTEATCRYRLLAASQVMSSDKVLEIGCSNGECSAILLKYLSASPYRSGNVRYDKNCDGSGTLVGLDVSEDMIRQARLKLARARHRVGRQRNEKIRLYCCDPFLDPKGAELLATSEDCSEKNSGSDVNALTSAIKHSEENEPKTKKSKCTVLPNVIFCDIGGNRNLSSVVRMVHWAKTAFRPELVVIKSEEMVQQCIADLKDGRGGKDETGEVRGAAASVSLKDGGLIVGGEDWFRHLVSKSDREMKDLCSGGDGKEPQLNQFRINFNDCVLRLPPKYTHPLKAPMSLLPNKSNSLGDSRNKNDNMGNNQQRDNPSIAICRYHNYHKQGCRKGTRCPFDHTTCHWCLKPGHVALDCPGQ